MPDFEIEDRYLDKIVIGIDEAGRGPLAGPVVAAAVIVNRKFPVNGINDSKKLTAKRREELYNFIIRNYQYAIGIVEADEIDNINILQATIKACYIAESGLAANIPDNKIVLVDGNMKFQPPYFHSIIKGDGKSISIAAASIVAKVTRDKIMSDLSVAYPCYGWQKNFGYGTKDHITAILNNGRTKHHRVSFKIKG